MSSLENQPSANVLDAFLRHMEDSFHGSFVQDDGKKWIVDVVEALERNEPILSLVEGNRGSFSTLFLPFHGGTILSLSTDKLESQSQLDPRLLEFCRLAGSIENLTDTFATYEDEPSAEEKQKLLPLLRHFLALLPSMEEFKTWLPSR